MQKWVWPKIIITEEHKAKICLEMICKFMNLWEDELEIPDKPNMCVKDYSLEQFQWWVGKKIQWRF